MELSIFPNAKSNRKLHSLVAAIVVLVVSAFAMPALAQCIPQWLPGDALPGVNGTVNAILIWDPDGAGPQPPLLVVAGLFTTAGDVAAKNIAIFDTTTGHWSTLGSGMNGAVNALAVTHSGNLLAGGSFNSAGGVPANRIALWNGSAWSPLGSGLGNAVYSLARRRAPRLP